MSLFVNLKAQVANKHIYKEWGYIASNKGRGWSQTKKVSQGCHLLLVGDNVSESVS